jgi:threonine dehydrogenase-like Zn-dependent dehydrogenase
MVAEINPYRIELLAELGLRPENLLDGDFEEKVKSFTNGAGADAVFEVTGRQEGINLAVKLPKVRGKIVAVGIFSKPPEIDLFQFFWKELELYGARVYEREDFETAIELIKNGQVPVNRLISAIYSLEELEKGLKEMEKGGNIMKILIKCSE